MTVPATELALAERLTQIWDGLRLVAIDLETTGNGRDIRVVSLAAITMRRQMVTGTWSTLVNPGVAISKATTRVHGITDDHVRSEPTFPEIRDQVIATLTPATPTEQVVFVAHNAAFDLGALRADLGRHPDGDGVLLELPDVAVLDTYATEFHALAGLTRGGRSLAAVADRVGVSLTAAHNATSDALASAQIAARLVERAAARGHATFAGIHEATGGKTTRTQPTSTTIRRGTKTPTLSEAHAATHTRSLPSEPTEAQWEQWRADVTACVLSACPRLVDRLQSAPFTAEHSRRLRSLTRTLAQPDESGRVRSAALNTVAHALTGNLARALDRSEDPDRQGVQARQLLTSWAGTLRPARPCTHHASCPGCATGNECGHDTWWRPLVPALRGPFPPVAPPPTGAGAKADQARAAYRDALAEVDRWFRPDKSTRAGTGVLVQLAGHHQVAAAYAVWTVIEWHLAAGRLVEADTVAALAVTYGYLDPRTVNHHLTHLTHARRAGDIKTALAICSTALATRGDSTDSGWALITSRAAHLAGIAERLHVTYTDAVDEDGNRIPKRRHHPDQPRRSRPLRFARDPNEAAPDLPGTWVRVTQAARQLGTTTLEVTKLAAAGKLEAQTVNGVAWFEAAALEAHQQQTKAPTQRVPLRKSTTRPLPKQARRTLPGKDLPATGPDTTTP